MTVTDIKSGSQRLCGGSNAEREIPQIERAVRVEKRWWQTLRRRETRLRHIQEPDGRQQRHDRPLFSRKLHLSLTIRPCSYRCREIHGAGVMVVR